MRATLYDRHGIEVPVFPWPAGRKRAFRVSAQVYNDQGQYDRLATALRSELNR